MEKTTNSAQSTNQSFMDELTAQDMDEGFAHSRHYVTKLYEMTKEIWDNATDGYHKKSTVSINAIYDTIVELQPRWAGPDKREYRFLSMIFPPKPVSALNGHIHKLKRQIIQETNAGIIACTAEEKLEHYKRMRGNTLVFIDTCLCIASYAHGIFSVKRKARKLSQAQPD